MRSRPTAYAAVFVGGGLATALVAAAVGLPDGDAVQLAAMCGAASLVAGVVGVLVLRSLASRSLLAQVSAVAIVAVAAVAAGLGVAAQAMFISTHDLSALAVVLAAATTVSSLTAMYLADRLVAGTALVRSAARSMEPGNADATPARTAVTSTSPVPAELAGLVAELDEIRGRLERSRQRERALERSRRELVAWVSHDLRTPLAGLRAMVEALEDGVVSDPAEVASYHASMRGEVDRLAALVTDLFELSRIQSGTLRLQPARVSVADVVSDVLAGATPLASARGVHIAGEVDGVGPVADLSVPEFQRALHNLVDNAIRHTPPDGSVLLHVGQDGSHVLVSVADGCGGIPDHDLDRVFDVAFSGDHARTPTLSPGAGLGLSITRGIVEAHAGDVQVCNEGEGCRFTIRVPLAAVA